jgi:hypothetical protein
MFEITVHYASGSLQSVFLSYTQAPNTPKDIATTHLTTLHIIIYYVLWHCSPARAMASCGSAAQCGLWPPVTVQPSAGYGLLWLCSPARVMASCGCAAQRRLWPPVALQPSAGSGLL